MWDAQVLEPRLVASWGTGEPLPPELLRDPLVATVSLGARRSFLLRLAAGGPVARRYGPGEGDLLVMGGACQHEWQHTVPRQRSASGAG